MARGLRGLATIAATAPLLGLFGNAWGIVFSFEDIGDSRTSGLVPMVSNLSLSMAPTAYGLGLAIVAWWAFTYLSAQSAQFEIEMRDAIRDLSHALSLHVAARVPRR